jgi:hypothetical protein
LDKVALNGSKLGSILWLPVVVITRKLLCHGLFWFFILVTLQPFE